MFNGRMNVLWWTILVIGSITISSMSHQLCTGFCSAFFCFSLQYGISSYGFMIYLLIFFRVASLALGQSYDCPSASEATLKDMTKLAQYPTTTKHNQAWTMYIILGMYCTQTQSPSYTRATPGTWPVMYKDSSMQYTAVTLGQHVTTAP